jgi:integrase
MNDVAKLRGLHRRGPTYYSRIVVPSALVLKFGRREIWKSLRTSKRSEAEALHLKEAAFWSAAFAQAQYPTTTNTFQPSSGQPLTNEEVATLARQFFSRAKAQLDLNARGPADFDPEDAESAATDIEWQLSSLQSWANPDAHRLVDEARRQALGSTASRLSDVGGTDELLAELLRRALVQLGSLQLARLNGDYRDTIDDSFFRNGTGARADDRFAVARGATLGDCIDRFRAEVLDLRSVTAKTRFKHQSLLKHIGDHFGRRSPLAEISRADCNGFRDVLAKLPPNFGKGAKAKRSIAQIAEANRSGRTLAWETQSVYLKMLSDLMAWAVRERLIADNVAEHISPLKMRQAAEAQRLPFSATELKSILATPLYTGCVDDERRFSRPGPNVIRRSRYWLPLIALFTGMRMGEILQLTPGHLRTSAKGTSFFVLTRDMKLKTGSSEREVPIHPELVKLGLLKWVGARRRSGAKLLFDDVPESKHGYRSDTFTKRFASFLRSVDLPADRRAKLCFHSFRHTFKDALNETGASEEVKDEICGWARSKKTGRRYGTGLSADQLVPYLERVTYNLDLSALRAAAKDFEARR